MHSIGFALANAQREANVSQKAHDTASKLVVGDETIDQKHGLLSKRETIEQLVEPAHGVVAVDKVAESNIHRHGHDQKRNGYGQQRLGQTSLVLHCFTLRLDRY